HAPEPVRIPGPAVATVPGPDELTTTALLGTARRPLDPGALPAPVAELIADPAGDPPLALLEAAALREASDLAARTPEAATPPDPAAEDPRPLLPEAAALRLSGLLRARSPFLPEWFEAASPHDYRAPGALCARLLESAQADSALRGPL